MFKVIREGAKQPELVINNQYRLFADLGGLSVYILEAGEIKEFGTGISLSEKPTKPVFVFGSNENHQGIIVRVKTIIDTEEIKLVVSNLGKWPVKLNSNDELGVIVVL